MRWIGLVVLMAASVMYAEETTGNWYVRTGVVGILYQPKAEVTAGGAVVPGASATTSNQATVTFDVGYFLTKNIAASVLVGIPAKPTLTGTGTAAAYGDLGSVLYGPGVVSGHYHFRRGQAFEPYVGGGFAYAMIFKNYDGAIKNLDVHNNFAPVLQAGAEFKVAKRWSVFGDFKQVWLSVNADGKLAGVIPATARVQLWPSLVSMGVTYHFGR